MFEDILNVNIPLDRYTLENIAKRIEDALTNEYVSAGMYNHQYMSNEACRLFEEISGKKYKDFDIRVALVEDMRGQKEIKVIIGMKKDG